MSASGTEIVGPDRAERPFHPTRRPEARVGSTGGCRGGETANLGGLDGERSAHRPSRASDAPSLAVVDDEQVTCNYLREMVETLGVYRWAGSAHTAATGRELVHATAPNLVVVDLVLPDADGWWLIRRIREDGSTAKLVVMTGRTDDFAHFEAARIGVAGFVSKLDMEPRHWERLLGCIAAGGTCWTPTAWSRLRALRSDSASWTKILSPREIEQISVCASTADSRRASQLLGVSPSSMKTIRTRLLQKLGLRSLAELTIWAARHGFMRGLGDV